MRSRRGYGGIGRRYGLDWIEPWYGNLLSENFQIQRNPGIKDGQSWAKSCVQKTRFRKRESKKRDRCRDSMEAVLTNRVDCIGKGILSFYPNDRKDDLVYVRIHTETSND